MNSENKISAALVFDVIGRPPEHLVEALNGIVEQIGKEKGVAVTNKKVNEPVLMKDRKDFYTTFAEAEVEVEEIINLIILMFKYMPAHIEIISPERVTLSNSGWSDVLSELTRRLHGYDEIARMMQFEKGILEKKLRELLGTNPENQNPAKEKPKEAEKPRAVKKSKKK
jgi:hypothetical protein